jgi:DNA-binding NarL/FixJ family response regulator
MRTAIVDDVPNIRNSLMEKLSYQPGIEVVFTANNGRDFLEKMKQLEPEKLPQVVLMDIDMPVMNGIEAIANGSAIYPQVKYLVLTVFDDDDKIFDAIKAGANGYLLKDDKLVNIVDSLTLITEYGGAPMSPLIATKALRMLGNAPALPGLTDANDEDTGHNSDFALTRREKEILALLAQSLDSTQIANRLFLSVHTVRKHITNIYDKLHVCSRVQAVQVAIKHRWV